MRTRYKNLDIPTIVLWLLLVGVGLLAIYSTSRGPAEEFYSASPRQNFERQLMWVGICCAAFVVALLLPIRFYRVAAFPIYGVTIVLLLVALFFGRPINGAKAWLSLGGMQLQVSEIAKVGTILAVAQLVGMRRPKTMDLKFALMVVGIILLPAIIIERQNDLGTALVFFGMIPITLFWSGLEFNLLMLMVAPVVAGYLAIVYMPAAIVFAILFTGFMYWRTRDRRLSGVAALFTGGVAAVTSVALTSILQPHQVERILSFTNPGAAEYRYNAGFHQVQSMAAIGSGGFAGKGFMKGSQTQGAYVPEQSTDFVFSVIGEEFGFIGTFLVLALFAMLLIRMTKLGVNIRHPFGMMVACAAAGIYLVHIFVNVGMATSLLPVIGIPLPFISYGGSALLANTSLLAIVLSLHLKKDDFSIYGY